MALLDWSNGYRKVGKKARRGRKKNPAPHHRKKLPSYYDRDHATERRQKINEMRERDADD